MQYNQFTTEQKDNLTRAHTLREYYAALSQNLPDFETRIGIYNALGLGQPSTYIGSAEQNNRMLVELKRQAGIL